MAIAATRRRSFGAPILLYLAAALVAALAVLPFYWLVSTSIKPANQVATNPPILFPTSITLQNYVDVFRSEGITRFALNSVVISISSTAFLETEICSS